MKSDCMNAVNTTEKFVWVYIQVILKYLDWGIVFTLTSKLKAVDGIKTDLFFIFHINICKKLLKLTMEKCGATWPIV